MIVYDLKASSSQRTLMVLNSFVLFLSSLSRRLIVKEIFFMPYLQAHREMTMADLITFTMNSQKSGAEVKFSLKQLLISSYANAYIDSKL